MAVIIDTSGSVSAAELDLEKDFAKSAVASFAAQNLFTNGGTASYASFSTVASEGGTFASSAEFDEFVDNDPTAVGFTNIEAGLRKGRELLNAGSSATTSFLILITDGDWNLGADPQVRASQSRFDSIRFDWSRALSKSCRQTHSKQTGNSQQRPRLGQEAGRNASKRTPLLSDLQPSLSCQALKNGVGVQKILTAVCM